MTPHLANKVRRLHELGFTFREIQNVCQISNADLRTAFELTPIAKPRVRPFALADAANEMKREGYDERLIAANFGVARAMAELENGQQ